MSHALVVYESFFGNVQAVAMAVAEGLAGEIAVETMAAGVAPRHLDDEVALLVVGAPNHQLGLPRPRTRREAINRYEAPGAPVDFGLREWLGGLSLSLPGVPAAAFDTRLIRPRLIRRLDRASHTEETLLRRQGLRIVQP